MPIYTASLTVPAGTAQNSPASVEISVNEWTVIGFHVYFPPGCAGTVHIAVYYGSEQIAPKPTGASIRGDGETVSWPEEWKCPEKPCTLTFLGWSPSASYDHTVLIRVVTKPEHVEESENLAKQTQRLIMRFLKRVLGAR